MVLLEDEGRRLKMTAYFGKYKTVNAQKLENAYTDLKVCKDFHLSRTMKIYIGRTIEMKKFLVVAVIYFWH